MGLALRALGQKQAASERELVAAVRTGDDRAFEELFARYRSRITAYVLGMVRDHARAEDITQEVFLSALRRLRDTERPIAFKPWIYEIARNACIDEFRRTRRATEVSLNGDDDSSGPERDLVSKQPPPDVAMENKQRLQDLRGAFRGLSENHHRILVMRELEGLSYAEIANRLEMSKPMVESTLFRARRRLGEEYEDLTTGRRCQQVCEVVDRADARSIKVLGIRARRQVAQHLSHCDDCRRYARLAGADEALFRAPSVADKVAALFPFGWLGRRLGARFIARHLTGASHFFGSSCDPGPGRGRGADGGCGRRWRRRRDPRRRRGQDHRHRRRGRHQADSRWHRHLARDELHRRRPRGHAQRRHGRKAVGGGRGHATKLGLGKAKSGRPPRAPPRSTAPAGATHPRRRARLHLLGSGLTGSSTSSTGTQHHLLGAAGPRAASSRRSCPRSSRSFRRQEPVVNGAGQAVEARQAENGVRQQRRPGSEWRRKNAVKP